MKENRIKTSIILENQLPSFVQEEYPLFIEFLQKYYASIENQGGIKDLLENIDQYVKLDSFTNLVESTTLSSDIKTFDKTISVESTRGFPLKSGIIQINDEIIFYSERDPVNHTFIGCIRGFSGKTTNKDGNINELVFLDSSANSHLKDTEVRNLSILFLKIFLEKTKKLLTPGFENRELAPDLNQVNFIRQSKDFYSSKGSSTSFKILFNALYGTDVNVIRPSDYLFEASNADYRINKVIAAEAISGDINNLLNKTIFQDQYANINKAYGTVNNIEKVEDDGQVYYLLSLDNEYLKDINVIQGTIFGDFSIHPSTRIITEIPGPFDSSPSTFTLDVDSTVGFPNEGSLYIDFEDGRNLEIFYTSKSLTQFFGCSGINREIPAGTKIRINTFVYGYGDSEKNEVIKFKITGVLSEFKYPDDALMMSSGDTIQISSLGYSNPFDFKANNWIINLTSKYKIKNIKNNGNFNYEITTHDPINILNGDRVIINGIIRTRSGSIENVERLFEVSVGSDPYYSLKLVNDTEIVSIYSIQRLLRKVVNSDINSDVQNTYVDSEGSVYVTSPSLPFYYKENLDSNIEFVSFDANLNNQETIGALNHGFITGDAVVYIPGDGDNKLNIDRGVYFVKQIDNNSFKIAKSTSNLFKNKYISLSGIVTSNLFVPLPHVNNTSDFSLKQIKDQNIIRKISEPSDSTEINLTSAGKVGIFANGVEILNYKSNDFIKYGLIENIDILSGGSGYDVINPPNVVIQDEVGFGASANCHVTGSLYRIDIIDSGFDYLNIPRLSIEGGNGKNASARANLSAITHSVKFNAIEISGQVDLVDNSITFSENHRFRDGEQIIYRTQGGVAVGGLINSSSYYASVVTAKKIRIHNSNIEAVNKINQINLNSYGSGIHLFESFNKKKKITSFTILDSGFGYSNKKNYFNETNIDLYLNTFNIPNHGYLSGDIIKYNSSNTVVGGLSENEEYYVTKLDSNTFRLSKINQNGVEKDFYFANKIYVDLLTLGDGIFNYPEIKVSLSGVIGISSSYSTGISGIGTFDSTKLNYISISSTANIQVGHVLTPVSGFIGTDTRVTYIESNRIGLSTSHLYTAGVTTTNSISFNEYIDFYAKIIPVFRGGISAIQINNAGVGYGSSEIINYDRQPEVNLISGKQAFAIPIVLNGSIKEVLIQNAGTEYNSRPDIIVTGSGYGAVLSPIIDENGTISKIQVINGGLGYDSNTKIVIQSSGSEVKINCNIRKWTVNLFEKYDRSNKISEDGGFVIVGHDQLQVCHLYPPSDLRNNLYSYLNDGENIVYRSDLENDSKTNPYHSPIIGWAYDGNPIYGPYGYKNPSVAGEVSQMRSGYVPIQRSDRPSNFQLGFFVEDYEYRGTGDLDIHNGRFCKTPEYPNGVYAYFATLSQSFIDIGNFANKKKPVFPYLIGLSFKSVPISFNFSSDSVQKNFDSISKQYGDLSRNTFKYFLQSDNTSYEFFTNLNRNKKETSQIKNTTLGSIADIEILSAGSNYKVGDEIIFENAENDNGYGALAVISEVEGKNITKIYSKNTNIEDIEIIPSTSAQNEYIFISKNPHELKNDQSIFISGISTDSVSLKNTYKIKTITNTLQLRTGVGTIFSTGITTHFNVAGNFSEPNLLENDLYKVENEIVKILEIDRTNSKVKVLRGVNGKDGQYPVGAFLIEESRKFAITDSSIQSYDYNLTREYYFDPNSSLGIGTTGTYTLFFNKSSDSAKVAIGTGSSTLLYFNNNAEILNYAGGYIDIYNATNGTFNKEKTKIISVGSSSISVDFNSSALGIGTTGVIATIKKWNSLDIPVGSIYLPNHKFTTGQKVKYVSAIGTGISVSTGSSTFVLEDDSILYVAKISSDLIGISTVKVGVGTTGSFVGVGTTVSVNLLNFVGFGTGTVHSFSTTDDKKILTATVESYLSVVETDETPNLLVGDNIKVVAAPNYKKNVSVIYNDTNRRLLIDPIIFNSSNVDVENNIINLNNHKFKHGEKVLFTSTQSAADLIPNRSYYVSVITKSKFKLYKSVDLITLPVIIDTAISGTLSKINPQIDAVKGSTVVFNLSDSSLSFIKGSIKYPAFTFELFKDNKFTTKFLSTKKNSNFEVSSYGTIGVSTDARVELKINDSIPDNLWYTLTPVLDPSLDLFKKQIIIDNENNLNNNKISKKISNFEGQYSIVSVSSTDFAYSLNSIPESNEYLNNSNQIKYSSTSRNINGGISKISLISRGKNYQRLPSIKTIKTVNGKDAILFPLTKNIGLVNRVRLNSSGTDYPSDNTLRPKAKLPQIARVTPLSSFKSIKVLDRGINYSSPPNLIVKDSTTNKIINDVGLKYSFDNIFVEIVKNTNELYNSIPFIIPSNNTNGISIKDITYDSVTKLATVILSANYSSIEDFPFQVGNRFLLENISTVTEFGTINRGYNSINYDYELFVVESFDAKIGGSNASVTFSLKNLLRRNESPGTFDPINSIPKIIPETYFPQFEIKIQKNNFYIKEYISNLTNTSYGIVEYWDKNSEYLKISSSTSFYVGDIILGESSKCKGVIEKIISYNGEYDIASSTVVEQGWKNNTGFLNDQLQRIHDNDYYQYLSYALKSIIPFDRWDDAVSSLAHIAGYKKFSDLSVESIDNSTVGIGTTQDFGEFGASTDFDSLVKLSCFNDFDLASEESISILNKNASERILLNSSFIQDYDKSIGNRVLIVDDISSQFNSEPRFEKYDVVNTVRLSDVRFRKYFMCIADQRFTSEKEIIIITFMHNGDYGYLNQYARVDTFGDLGYFDFQIFGSEGLLQFYPNKYEFNNYNTSFVSFDLNDVTDSGVLDLGTSTRIRTESKTIPTGIGSTTVFEMPISYRSAKLMLMYNRDDGSYEMDEISIVHNGTDVEILEYGQLIDNPKASSFSSVGFGTYEAFIENSTVKLNLNLLQNNSIDLKSFIVELSSAGTGIASTTLNTGNISSSYVSIAATDNPVETIVSSFDIAHSGSYYFACVEDLTNSRYQVSEIVVCSAESTSNITEYAVLETDNSLGTFSTDSDGTFTYLKFTPLEDINVNVRVFETSIKIPTTFYDLTSIDIT